MTGPANVQRKRHSGTQPRLILKIGLKRLMRFHKCEEKATQEAASCGSDCVGDIECISDCQTNFWKTVADCPCHSNCIGKKTLLTRIFISNLNRCHQIKLIFFSRLSVRCIRLRRISLRNLSSTRRSGKTADGYYFVP